MEYMLISFEIIFPIFVYMVVGYAIKKSGLVNADGFNMMNRMVFQIFLPLKLFIEIYESDFKSAFQLNLVTYVVFGVLFCFTALCIAVPRFVKDPRNSSVIIQGIYRSNYVIFGLSVAASIYEDGDIGVVSVLAAFIVPIFNILAVILFEMFRGGKLDIKTMAKGVVSNHFVIVAIISFFVAFTGLSIPKLFFKPLKDMSLIASPLAVICLGASFSLGTLKKYLKYTVVCCAGRLIIVPGIFIALAAGLGYRNIELVAVMLVFGSPTATVSYAMAKELGGNEELAGVIIAITSLFSIISMFLWILLLKFTQLI